MKRIQHICMLAVVATAFCACSGDDDFNVNDMKTNGQPVVAEGSNITFVSTIGEPLQVLAEENMDGGNNAGTRSTMSSGTLASWATSDKISISDGTLMYIYQPEEGSINGASCSFQSKSSASFLTDGTGEEGIFRAFYPANAVLGWNGTTVTTMIYTEQKYEENMENSGVMGPYMTAVATTTGGGANANFTFGHICSVIDVDLSTFDGGEVESVALYANSQASIAGRMKYNTETKAATVVNNDATDYSFSTQSEMIRVSQVNATNPIVRFYVLPVQQTKGFTITVRTNDGKYYTKTSSTAVGTSEPYADYLATLSGVANAEVCKPYYKKYKFGAKGSARTQNWMAMIPGNVKFNFLSLPGTHDAATSSGSAGSTAAAKCQEYSIAEQLNMGCRALDLRPGFNKSDLTIYHGGTSTGITLETALTNVKTFLQENPTETVFILIHEEDTRTLSIGSGPHQTSWATRVWNCVNGFTDCIASYGWAGNLNPCRGKMVVIFRDEYKDGDGKTDLGCGRVGWGSSFSDKSIEIEGNTKGILRYQDEYNTSDEGTKLDNLTKMLNEHIAANETNANYTFVNNTNIASGTSNVSNFAKKVNNAVLGSSTFTNHTGRFGIMMTDFLFSSGQSGDKMFELIHKQNYKYVYKGRTRCAAASGTETGATVSSDEFADDGTVYSRKDNTF